MRRSARFPTAAVRPSATDRAVRGEKTDGHITDAFGQALQPLFEVHRIGGSVVNLVEAARISVEKCGAHLK